VFSEETEGEEGGDIDVEEIEIGEEDEEGCCNTDVRGGVTVDDGDDNDESSRVSHISH
jgi:hypothetical protein